ncbi:RsmB/NOP family class I SAM-dependent RNA methyltransferase [Candidatus Micrarchaeota archaeon]|nr:RsmB/NOP family class I SAM-dependent RNA methyltransferase [Candidatus Micrarchaeota archaeon]
MEEKAFCGWLSNYTDCERCLSAFRSQKQFFRVNTIKISVPEFMKKTRLKCAPTPYYGDAFELGERESFQIGKTWEYFLGLIHPQSMPSILASLALGPKPGETVLDVASAPGSKFSHMAALMQNEGVLVGNDLKGEKISALYSTINRLDVRNCIITTLDGSRLPWKSRFDRILLDAPCTALGSGMAAYGRWEPEHSVRISGLQKRMLFAAFDALRPGGTLVYSTCTYAKEENEEVVKNLLDNVPAASLADTGLDVPHEPGIADYGKEFGKCLRIYPQHLGSEGFFISKIRKGE